MVLLTKTGTTLTHSFIQETFTVSDAKRNMQMFKTWWKNIDGDTHKCVNVQNKDKRALMGGNCVSYTEKMCA